MAKILKNYEKYPFIESLFNELKQANTTPEWTGNITNEDYHQFQAVSADIKIMLNEMLPTVQSDSNKLSHSERMAIYNKFFQAKNHVGVILDCIKAGDLEFKYCSSRGPIPKISKNDIKKALNKSFFKAFKECFDILSEIDGKLRKIKESNEVETKEQEQKKKALKDRGFLAHTQQRIRCSRNCTAKKCKTLKVYTDCRKDCLDEQIPDCIAVAKECPVLPTGYKDYEDTCASIHNQYLKQQQAHK